MSENRAPVFTGGRNVAIKVPEHAFEATVAFYRDTLALAIVYDAVGTKAFEFGPIRLWIDRMPHLAQGECGSSWWPATLVAGASSRPGRRTLQRGRSCHRTWTDFGSSTPPALCIWSARRKPRLADGGATHDA